jgi:hypothetical protein
MSPMPEYVYMHSDHDALFYIRAEWKLCRVSWPKKCELTGRWLCPGTLAYRGRAMYTGPGESAIEERWHNKIEHIIWQLKE